MTDPNDGVREHAVDELKWLFFDEWSTFDGWGVYDDSRAVEPLIAALKDKDSEVRSGAAWLLGVGARLDPSAVEPLITALKDLDPSVRWSAARSLGWAAGPRAVGPLIAALKDKDTKVRSEAAEALRGRTDPRTVEALIAALDDADPEVGKDAVSVLGGIKDPHVVESLIVRLKDKGSSVPWAAVLLWYQITDHRARAAEPLIAARVDPLIAARVDPLIAAMKGGKDPRVRTDAAEALGEIGAPAVDSLIAALGDQDLNVRLYAAYALYGADPLAFDDVALKASGLFDVVFVAKTYAVIVSNGDPASEDRLIDALNKFGDAQMAWAYLNCGNPRLGAAASKWGAEHGYEVVESESSHAPDVRWGGNRP